MSTTQLIDLLSAGFVETLWIILSSSLFAYGFGFPLGVLVTLTGKEGLYPKPVLSIGLNRLINIFRSIPFYILVVALMPLSRFVVGTSLGIKATIFALSVGAIPFVARLVEAALLEVDTDMIESVVTMGATKYQIIVKVLLREALPQLIQGLSITMIMLVGYSAMAGLMGGGGLGDIAIRYGYYRYDYTIMYYALFILIVLVEVIQISIGSIVKQIDKRNK